MLNDWTHWLSSMHREQLLWLLAPMLLLDMPRYALGAVLMCVVDYLGHLASSLKQFVTGYQKQPTFEYCPSVCVIIAGLNEADTIGHTLDSLRGSYPRMETIIVDDGSTDGMSSVARQFASREPGITVLRKPHRGGKSSALNFALPFTQAEILVCVDGDSHLAEAAIWEIVQPFQDPDVGAVSGAVTARNPFDAVVTWLQAFEYLRCIFLGRLFAARLDILGIISGAFGAYRRDTIERLGGWDLGPGEDGDLTLRLRKCGFKIAFAPYAQCLTNLPTSWKRLVLQRRRWEWAVVTFECRKHVDLASPFSRYFRWSNLLLLIDRWLYNVVLTFLFWGYMLWLTLHTHQHTGKLFFTYYLVYLALDLLTLVTILYYSNNRRHDFIVGLVFPLMPFYNLMQRAVRLWAVTEEMLSRRSFRDNFVPPHVRDATWHW